MVISFSSLSSDVNLTDFSPYCEAGHHASYQRTTLQSWCDNSLKTAFSNILVIARPDLSAQTEHRRTKQKGTFKNNETG